MFPSTRERAARSSCRTTGVLRQGDLGRDAPLLQGGVKGQQRLLHRGPQVHRLQGEGLLLRGQGIPEQLLGHGFHGLGPVLDLGQVPLPGRGEVLAL